MSHRAPLQSVSWETLYKAKEKCVCFQFPDQLLIFTTSPYGPNLWKQNALNKHCNFPKPNHVFSQLFCRWNLKHAYYFFGLIVTYLKWTLCHSKWPIGQGQVINALFTFTRFRNHDSDSKNTDTYWDIFEIINVHTRWQRCKDTSRWTISISGSIQSRWAKSISGSIQYHFHLFILKTNMVLTLC